MQTEISNRIIYSWVSDKCMGCARGVVQSLITTCGNDCNDWRTNEKCDLCITNNFPVNLYGKCLSPNYPVPLGPNKPGK